MRRTALFTLLPFTLLPTLLCVLAAAPALAENRALLVGIGYYEVEGATLPGVDQDIKMMREVALTLGFEPAQIRTLSHSEATLDHIVEAIETWLVEGTTPGDRALLYHSGHGTVVPDEDGDEEDGNDEALLPYDFTGGAPGADGSKPSRVLVDDELGRLLKRIPAHEVVVLVDSCHSGTMTRAITRTHKFYSYPDAPRGKPSSLMDLSSDGYDPVILLSAAEPDEEAQTSARGALFTRGVYEAVRRARDRKLLTLEQLRQEAEVFISRAVGKRTKLRHTPTFDGNPLLRGLNLFLPEPVPEEEAAESPTDNPPSAEQGEDLWSRLELLVRDAGEPLGVRASKRAYRVGESLEISVVAPADGFLYVLNVGEGEDELVLLFPNRYQPDNRVRAGQTVRVPDRGRFLLPARLPGGRAQQSNLVAVIHTSSPLGIEGDTPTPEETFRILRSGEAASTLRSFRPAPADASYSAGQMVVTIENEGG